jgi:hypothetical protein
MIDIAARNKKILQIKQILLDISQMYDSNGLKCTFNIPQECKNAEKIKVEVTEFR